jgi:hypothetical protein
MCFVVCVVGFNKPLLSYGILFVLIALDPPGCNYNAAERGCVFFFCSVGRLQATGKNHNYHCHQLLVRTTGYVTNIQCLNTNRFLQVLEFKRNFNLRMITADKQNSESFVYYNAALNSG